MLGSGAVVTKDVPPYAIVVGQPARILRTRFPDEVIADLMDVQWWRYDETIIKGLPLHDLPATVSMLRERIASGDYALLEPHHELWSQ